MSSLVTEYAKLLFPLLIGAALACPLYGIAVAQAASLLRHYPKDHVMIKYFILILVLIDGAHTFSLADGAKTAYLKANVDLRYPKGFLISLYFAYITVTMVQSAYALRVWILSGRKWVITPVLAFLILCQLASGLGIAIRQQITGQIGSNGRDTFSTIFGPMEAGSAMICDVLISASLVYLLHKGRSGIRVTESLIDKLIAYVIGIGLLTSIFALISLVAWLALDNFIFIAFHTVTSKLYVNSLLVTLNSRRWVDTRDTTPPTILLSDFGTQGGRQTL